MTKDEQALGLPGVRAAAIQCRWTVPDLLGGAFTCRPNARQEAHP